MGLEPRREKEDAGISDRGMGMRPWLVTVSFLLIASILVGTAGSEGVLAAPAGATTTGLVDTATGEWHLRGPDGWTTSFYYGNPNDVPMMGDWDCDGIDTPGLYRQADGYVYLRNSNSQGAADVRFFFGDPGDMPLAGDFDGDGCDTVSIWRRTEGRVYVINELGADDAGLGEADFAFYFGDPFDQPFVGDFDGDGIDTIGLHRSSTGLVYFRDSNSQGIADHEFYFGNPNDLFVAGDWNSDGIDTVGMYRPSDTTFYLRQTNTQGKADATQTWGWGAWVPVAGTFGLPDRPLTERTWSSTVVDSTGDVGRFNDIAIGYEGPLISYGQAMGASWHVLRAASCTDAECAQASRTAVHGTMFESTSIAFERGHSPQITFFDPATQALGIAECMAADCSTAEVTTVYGDGAFGKYSEIARSSKGVGTIVASGDHTTSLVVWLPWPSKPPGAPQQYPPTYLGWQRTQVDGLNEHSRPALDVGGDGLARIAVPGDPIGPVFPLRLGICWAEQCWNLSSSSTVHEEVATAEQYERDGGSARMAAHTSIVLDHGDIATLAVSWALGPGLETRHMQRCDLLDADDDTDRQLAGGWAIRRSRPDRRRLAHHGLHRRCRSGQGCPMPRQDVRVGQYGHDRHPRTRHRGFACYRLHRHTDRGLLRRGCHGPRRLPPALTAPVDRRYHPTSRARWGARGALVPKPSSCGAEFPARGWGGDGPALDDRC